MPPPRFGTLLVALAALTCSPNGLAQEPAPLAISQYVQRNWGIDEGLPQNSVLAIAQTADGYVWLGTQQGLVRFDGLTFTVLDRRTHPELGSDLIRALLADATGGLWIGTLGGGVAHLVDGRLTPYRTADGLADDSVEMLAADGGGAVWVGTRHGLSLIRGGRIERTALGDRLAQRQVRAMLRDSRGALWAGTDEGLYRQIGDTIAHYTTSDGLPADMVWALQEGPDGTIWVGTRGGLATIAGSTVSSRPLPDAAGPVGVSALRVDRDGAVWIGTTSGRLHRWQDDAFASDSWTDNGGQDVLTIFEDEESNLWIGCDGGGLRQLRRGRFVPFGPEEGLVSPSVTTILEAGDTLWIGTEQGLSRIRDGRVESFGERQGLGSLRVTGLHVDAGGTLWVGTEFGLYRFEGGRFVRIEAIGDETVRAIAEDASGALWVGAGPALVARRQAGWTRQLDDADLEEKSIFALLPDEEGGLWIGTFGGGLMYLENGRLTVYDEERGLSSNFVLTLHRDADGTIWAGTTGGLSRIRNGAIARFTRAEGLHDETILHILEDRSGRFWMSTNRGIFEVARADLDRVAAGEAESVTAVAYGTADGMRTLECNGGAQPAGWAARDGRLWFPTARGAVVVNPADDDSGPVPPPVAVERVVANGVSMPARGEIEVPPGPGELEFHFTGLSFAAPRRVTFRYRLEGFDGDWVEAGTRRAAYYTNISPGAYRFLVQAGTGDGVWNEDGAAVGLILQPYFHQTWMFYGLTGLALVGLMLSGHRLRVRQLRAREQALQREVEERTRELRAANEALERLARLDSVTGIANHRQFQDTLRAEWRRALRDASPISLIMVDVDHFKDYNDTFGHQAGDACLHQIAGTLTRVARRPGDLAARYGGEEFAVVLARTDQERALRLAHQIRSQVEAMGLQNPQAPAGGPVTISAGVASATPALDSTWEELELVAAADRALYEAKRNGRNQVVPA